MRTIKHNGVTLDIDQVLDDIERVKCERSLYKFLQLAWKYIDPAPFSEGWPLQAVCEHLEAVARGDIKRLLINIPPRSGKSSLCSVAFPAWVWAQPENSVTSGPGVPFLTASYAYALALRDSVKSRRLISSPWYQKHWGKRFNLTTDQNTKGRYENNQKGVRLVTSVDAHVTGEGGNIIIIDDPNAAQEAFSEATIEATKDWWDNAMPTRLNDPKHGAFIIIQQRLSEEDLTGHILEKQASEWTHLCLPMEYESGRAFVTNIGWEDPRQEEGEPLWPTRFGPEEIERLKSDLGPWRCNPYEAPILMADLSLKPIGEIKIGDEIVGFEKNEKKEGRAHGRNALKKAKVLEIHRRKASVVKMALDSGEVVRCTPEHRWFTKERGPGRERYVPAKVGSKLARICPPKLPKLTTEQERDAGWLSGFFDGEGTVSYCRNPEFGGSRIISFCQGAGRNLPLCEKLERLLTQFGFEFGYSEDERKPNKAAPCYGYRTYRLKSNGSSLQTFQRFLHIVRPTKWRERIIEGSYKSNFIQQRERVTSITPDGEEEVYALTTTTGNYVVWGLASSNSAGQLQQRPEPKGGGIIKRDWWQLWEGATYPTMDYVIASLDSAYTTKTENDPSALTIFGVFSGGLVAQNVKAPQGENIRSYHSGTPCAMMMIAWTERLELHDLIKKVVQTCKQMRVDKLIIENKASGISVAQELRRLFAYEDFMVQLVDPKGVDKLARLYSVQHLFAEGMVFAPDRSWADKVITQVGTFPKGKHDDLVDCVSMSLRHLRDLGMLQRGPEATAELQQTLAYQGPPPKPLYEC